MQNQMFFNLDFKPFVGVRLSTVCHAVVGHVQKAHAGIHSFRIALAVICKG